MTVFSSFFAVNSWISCAIATGILLGSGILGKYLEGVLKDLAEKYQGKGKERGKILLKEVEDHIFFFALLGGIFFFTQSLVFPEAIQKGIDFFFFVITSLIATRIVERILLVFFRFSTHLFIKENGALGGVAQFFEKLISVTLWIFVALFIISNYGINVTSLIAGLGLGGVVFALAAQDTIKNLFASLSIFLDAPFQVGDMVRIGKVEGTIKEVGMRSSRIDTFGRTEVIIPNSEVANAIVENISRRSAIRFDFTLKLVYETPLEKIKEALSIVRDIVSLNPEVMENDGWVNLEGFGDSSFHIIVKLIVSIPEGGSYETAMVVREQVHLEILRQFEESGIRLAFPSQTLYLHQTVMDEKELFRS
ncbi:MAG: mechanosensitive ion channel family protein [Candidatus Peregrinibacteria bacterium]